MNEPRLIVAPLVNYPRPLCERCHKYEQEKLYGLPIVIDGAKVCYVCIFGEEYNNALGR